MGLPFLPAIELAVIERAQAAVDRFWALVEVCPVTGCWHWRGGISRGGQRVKHGDAAMVPYGSFYVCRGLILRAHIYVAWLFGIIDGPRVPTGCHLDHECENSLCVNPWHLTCCAKAVNQDYRLRKRRRRRPTWAELYTYRGLSGPADAVAAEPRHLRKY